MGITASQAVPLSYPPSPPPRRLVGDAVTVLDCPGPRFCGRTADQFSASALRVAWIAPRLVLNLSAVRELDAAGLRALSTLARAARNAGRELRLGGPRPTVRVLLAAADIHSYAEVYHTPDAAVAAPWGDALAV